MKYLLLSLSLWLYSYSVSSLQQDEFNSLSNHTQQKHFGIAATTQNISELAVMSDQLISMLKTSKEIDNKWQWGKVGSMEGDRLLVNVSEALIQYYPNKVYGYANLGALYSATKRYDEARKYYEKALEIDPDDEVVKENLQHLRMI